MAPVLRHCPCLRPENDDVRLLDYSHSNLDDVPNEVFSFERTLEELYLDANQIKDLPRPLFHCHGLRKLNLSDNEIETLPPAVASLINLEQLDISKNKVLEIPDNIKGCKCLNMIVASVNPLKKLPEGFTQLINLQELYLNDTLLEYLPANFGRLSRLKILELRENNLKVLPKSIARLTELSRLDIGQNDFVDLPEVIGNLPRLVELWCDSNKLSCLPPFLGGLKKLAYLDASKNRIYEVADEIEGCISLCDLTLSTNRIKALPEGIANLKKITVMRVDENRLTALPVNIGTLCGLEELVISSNDLTKLPASIGLLRSLRTLISDDNLLEDLPPEMGSCLNLTVLSLRDNKLVQIPDELGHITALKVINLSGNLLQHLPFSIAKLPNLQALWLSENQNKPLIPLQSDTEKETGQKVLTCFMLPQVPLNEEDFHETLVAEVDAVGEGKGKHLIKFAFDSDKDQPSKLIRAPTPYPKELKAHARHARNYALKKQGSKDVERNEVDQKLQNVEANPGTQKGENSQTVNTPDIMILPMGAPENRVKVKEAIVTKPKSPVASPTLQERHVIKEQKEMLSNEKPEILQHCSTEDNHSKANHESSLDVPVAEIPLKALGRRDSRGDGSSSEKSSASPTGSPKSAGTKFHPEAQVPGEKEIRFKKNTSTSGSKRDNWMRQRLLRQGSGDSDRGYRSDHEVYLAEKDQYGQYYPPHDGYASDWEAFLAKQNYTTNSGSIPMVHQYVRHPGSHGELGYRGCAEGQEIPDDGNSAYWDPAFHYHDRREEGHTDDRYHSKAPPYHQGFWQMDSSAAYYPYDVSQPYQPVTDEKIYFYPRDAYADVVPPQSQDYYAESGNFALPQTSAWVQKPHAGVNPRTLPKRLSDSSPRLKRSQCLSVQAPLHGVPQEYHLMPQPPPNIRHPSPGNSPLPGRSPSPRMDFRATPAYPPPVVHPKYVPPSHFQPKYPGHAHPVTSQPVNSSRLPPPASHHQHTQYFGPYEEVTPAYHAMPPSPRMKHIAQPYIVAAEESTLPYNPITPGVHNSNYYTSNKLSAEDKAEGAPGVPFVQQCIDPIMNQHGQGIREYQGYSYGNVPLNVDEYGVRMVNSQFDPNLVHHPPGSNYSENRDHGAPYPNQPVPSIKIIPSTSPPQTSYLPCAADQSVEETRKGTLPEQSDEMATSNPGSSTAAYSGDEHSYPNTNEQSQSTSSSALPTSSPQSADLSHTAVVSKDGNEQDHRDACDYGNRRMSIPDQVSECSKTQSSNSEVDLSRESASENKRPRSVASEMAVHHVSSNAEIEISRSRTSSVPVDRYNSKNDKIPYKSVGVPSGHFVVAPEARKLQQSSMVEQSCNVPGIRSVPVQNQNVNNPGNYAPYAPAAHGIFQAVPIGKSNTSNTPQHGSVDVKHRNIEPADAAHTYGHISVSSEVQSERKSINKVADAPFPTNNQAGNVVGKEGTKRDYVNIQAGDPSLICPKTLDMPVLDIKRNSSGISANTDKLDKSGSDMKINTSSGITTNKNSNKSSVDMDKKDQLIKASQIPKPINSQPPTTTCHLTPVTATTVERVVSQSPPAVKENKNPNTTSTVADNVNLTVNPPGSQNSKNLQQTTSGGNNSGAVENDSFASLKRPVSQNTYTISSLESNNHSHNNDAKTTQDIRAPQTSSAGGTAVPKLPQKSEKNNINNKLTRQHSKEDPKAAAVVVAAAAPVLSSVDQQNLTITRKNSKNSRNSTIASQSAASVPSEKNSNADKLSSVDQNIHAKTPVADKRFMKVLPPFDKAHQLKPCGARNSPKESVTKTSSSAVENPASNIPDVMQVDGRKSKEQNVQYTKVSQGETYSGKNPADKPPVLPPKKNTPLSTVGEKIQANNDVPPAVPPHKAAPASQNTGDHTRPPVPPHNKSSVPLTELHKNVNNKKNVDHSVSQSVQQGNMPDLLSRIGPEEKGKIINTEKKPSDEKPLKTDTKIPEKIVIADKEGNLNHTSESSLGSPKSPKRNSWFFGTHKNPLVFPVVIHKNPGVGFSIEGGIGSPRNPKKPNDDGIYVAQIVTNGPAYSALRPGDKILQVDGIDFTNLDHGKATSVLQNSGPSISLMISRE